MNLPRRLPPAPLRAPWLVLLAPLLAWSAVRGLWAPDEPRYAEIAREIFERKSFLVLHLCGAVYPDKPPLFYWLSGLVGWLSGWSVAAMRLVPLAATIGTALLTARLARRWWGEREALLAPLFLLATVMLTYIGGRLQIDPLLALLTTAAIVLATEERSERGARTRLVLAAGLATGLGALAKGPVAWANVGLVLVVWRVLGLGVREARAPRWSVLAAGLLAVLPVAAWAGLAILSEPSLARPLLFEEHVGRNVGNVPHAAPPWDHLLHLPVFLLPWTGLVLMGLVRGLGALGAARKGRADADRGLARAVTWLGVLFLFFSSLPPKRDLYLLPAYPAAALLAARWAAERFGGRERARWPLASAAGVLALAGALSLFTGPITARYDTGLTGLAWRGPLVGLPALVLGLVGLRQSLSGREPGALASVVLGWAATGTLAAFLLLTQVDGLKSARSVAEWVAARPEHPTTIPTVGVQPEGYRFYSGRPFVRSDDLEAALAADGPDFLGLVRESSWEEMPGDRRARFRVLHAQRVGSRDVLVLGTARPPGDSASPPPGSSGTAGGDGR